MIAQTISHYKILEKLGEGGMGVVYKAQDLKLDRLVALKFLPSYLTANEADKARFLQEAKAAAILNHPNICTIYAVEEHQGQQFIAMEFVDGKTFREMIRAAPIEINDAVRYAIQIGEALQEAHSKGIVHRDIKPDNIIVTSKNQIKVMDFGLAKLKGGLGLTKTGTTVGTIAYMSPEQIQTTQVDHRADIWSFGVVLFEMLSGRLPFRGEHLAAMVYSIGNEEPQPISRADTPQYLHTVIRKALEKEKSRRYQNVQELLADLKQPQATVSFRKQEKFVAVLPLTNMSASADDEYFSDGMTEDIIAQLSQIGSLRVISRTSVMRYKKSEKSTREIAAELGASHIIEGSVRRAGNRLRIVAQLIETTTDAHLWAQTFDRDMTDVFAIQSEVAERVADELKSRLTPDESVRIARRPTEDLEAYNLYLLGRHHYNQGNPEEFAKAIECYEHAIERDPRFARAYAMLTTPYLWQGAGYYGTRPRDAFAKVTTLASKALELDPDIAEAHFALGMFEQMIRFDHEAARQHYERSLALNPSSAQSHVAYGWYLLAMGRLDEAVHASRQAIELDPEAPVIRGQAIWNMYCARRLQEALAALQAAETHFQERHLLIGIHAQVLIGLGRASEAVPLLREAARLIPITVSVTMLAWALAAAGELEEARSLLRELHERERSEYVWPTGIAFAYAHLGDMDRAFEYLERSYEDRASFFFIGVASAPCFDQFRIDPRFDSLVRRVGVISAAP